MTDEVGITLLKFTDEEIHKGQGLVKKWPSFSSGIEMNGEYTLVVTVG